MREWSGPPRLLTEQEIEQLQINWMLSEQVRKEAECEASGGHQRVATKDTSFGWHEGHCARCGMNMNYDSSG